MEIAQVQIWHGDRVSLSEVLLQQKTDRATLPVHLPSLNGKVDRMMKEELESFGREAGKGIETEADLAEISQISGAPGLDDVVNIFFLFGGTVILMLRLGFSKL